MPDHRTIKDATKALQAHFSAAKPPSSLPAEARRMLQHFVDQNDGELSDVESLRANQELKSFWERHVAASSRNLDLPSLPRPISGIGGGLLSSLLSIRLDTANRLSTMHRIS